MAWWSQKRAGEVGYDGVAAAMVVAAARARWWGVVCEVEDGMVIWCGRGWQAEREGDPWWWWRREVEESEVRAGGGGDGEATQLSARRRICAARRRICAERRASECAGGRRKQRARGATSSDTYGRRGQRNKQGGRISGLVIGTTGAREVLQSGGKQMAVENKGSVGHLRLRGVHTSNEHNQDATMLAHRCD